MIETISFEEALSRSDPGQRQLLLGNGFSIDCLPDIFDYQRLLDRADFKETPRGELVFRLMGTADFEKVVRALREFTVLAPVYNASTSDPSSDADGIRDVLIQSIRSCHPLIPAKVPEEQFVKCWEFLKAFSNVFSLNYDLLLYWTTMAALGRGDPMLFNDGFNWVETAEGRMFAWRAKNYGDNKVLYLHGALHLFDRAMETQKHRWGETEPPILDQVEAAMRQDVFPLFVCEGTSNEKLSVIRRSPYLSHGFDCLQMISGTLYIFGHSLRDEDKHIIDQIKLSKITSLFVSIRDPAAESASEIKGRAIALADQMKIRVSFFVSSTAHVWR